MGSLSPAGQQPPPDGASDLTIVRSAAEPPSPDTAEPVRHDHDLAEADRIRRRRPRSLMLLTRVRISVRRWPRMTRRAVRALVAEQEGTAGLRDPARATHGEVVVHSIARRKAGGVLHSTYQRLSWLLRRTDRLRARKATLLARINLIPHEHVPHPDGGHHTLEQTQPTGTPWRPRLTPSGPRTPASTNACLAGSAIFRGWCWCSTSCCFCTSCPASPTLTGALRNHRSWRSRSPSPR